MKAALHVHRVRRWRSPLGPQYCPYENALRAGRWFFYRRFQEALRAAGAAPDARVLEVGCWQGHFLPSLLANYAEVWAIDNDSASLIPQVRDRWTTLQTAQDLCAMEGAQLRRLFLAKADGAALPFGSGSFDVVFCLDTLPFVPLPRRPSLIAEVQRVLQRGGTAVFMLPVEMGPALLIREIMRRRSGAWRDDYRRSELIRALVYKPRPEGKGSSLMNLIGYDYRPDEALIRQQFRIRRRCFLPSDLLKWLSPTLLLAGSNAADLCMGRMPPPDASSAFPDA